MLRLQRVSAAYDHVQVLRDVTLNVRPGEIVALIGANGAGKSTLLKVTSGLLPPGQGRVTFAGEDITGRRAESIVRLGMGHVPERRQIFGTLSVLDNLRLGAYHRYGREPKRAIADDIEMVLDMFPLLRERGDQSAGALSGGEQQMLAVGRGLMSRPKLLLLDEPSLGLAPIIVLEIMRVIAQLRERGVTMLLVEQNTKAALSVSDRAYVIETGRIVAEGVASELMNDERLRIAYLGRGHQRRPAATPGETGGERRQ